MRFCLISPGQVHWHFIQSDGVPHSRILFLKNSLFFYSFRPIKTLDVSIFLFLFPPHCVAVPISLYYKLSTFSQSFRQWMQKHVIDYECCKLKRFDAATLKRSNLIALSHSYIAHLSRSFHLNHWPMKWVPHIDWSILNDIII